MPATVNNSRSTASPKGQALRRAIDRFHILSEAFIMDAINKQDFKGKVSFTLHIVDGTIQVVEPTLGPQTIRDFSKM